MQGDSETVAGLVESLTRAEKLDLVRGAVDPTGTATGYVPGVDRLGIPELRLVDGPLGVRIPGDSATAFPAPIATGATFDPELARRKGAAMAREARAKNQDVLLAPGLNLIRVPNCGRNFEYYAEDPELTGAMAAAAVDGIQSDGVVATPKHFVANSQETGRARVSAEVSERALRELYLPGFRAAVEAGAGAVMTAYNRVNGAYMSEHRRLVTEILKDEWEFDGIVMSDWYGTESTVDAATAGLDLEMPGIPQQEMAGPGGGGDDVESESDGVDLGPIADGLPDPENYDRFGEALGDAIDAGEVPAERLDDMVARILGQMERFGLLDGEREAPSVDAAAHDSLATEIATRGTVLLENDGALPLAEDADIALIGPNVDEATLGGGGSSETTPRDRTTTAAGVRDRAAGSVTVERGVPRIESPSFFELLAGEENDDEGADGEDTDDRPDLDAAVDAAAAADVAVVVVRDSTTEAADREDLRLPGEQDELVEAVAAAADRTVVAVRSSGPVELPWRDEVDAILENWYPGQVDGEALARVLYGDADPGGRLPVTFAPEGGYPATEPRQYPGVDDRAHYDEGVFVGYRHFDAADAAPTYPFGHGESYAEFEYGDVAVEDGVARVDVENVADRDGREVVQAYVRPPETDVERPERELAGFAAVEVPAGGSETVEIELSEAAFARYDEQDGWTVDEGTYEIEVGRSSRDIRSRAEVHR